MCRNDHLPGQIYLGSFRGSLDLEFYNVNWIGYPTHLVVFMTTTHGPVRILSCLAAPCQLIIF